MTRSRYFFAASLLLCLGATSAYAAPIQWVLQDVVFDDGATASGSFFYDPVTDLFSSVSISTTDGTALSGSDYEFFNFEAGGLDADSVLLVAADNPVAGTPAFNLNLAQAMTSAGGAIDIATGGPPLAFESTCLISDCSSFFSLDRVVISGSISAVPVPAAVWLLGSALGLLGGLRGAAAATKAT